MTRVLATVWIAVSALLLARAYGAQSTWVEILQRLDRPSDYQTAAVIMAVVGLLSLVVAGTIAARSRALIGYPVIALTALLFLYSFLMLALGMHRYEPAFATLAVLALLLTSGATCLAAIVLRRRGEA